MIRSVLSLLAISIVGAGMVGCSSGPATATVSGSVKYQGKDLPKGVVTFYGPKDLTASTGIENGQYKIAKALVGDNKVTVKVFPAAVSDDPAAAAEAKNLNPVMPKSPIPEKYGDPAQSGLAFQVKSGSQTYDIDLK